jgi:glucose/arabinose dehydrogenase
MTRPSIVFPSRARRRPPIAPSLLAPLAAVLGAATALAQPTVVDANLTVRTVVDKLDQPVSMAFLGPDDFFVLEKASGQVKRVRAEGGVQKVTVVLDLPVNSSSERGLLGIALHPRFPRDPGVYLYWTESSTGADSEELDEVGNPNSQFPPGTSIPMGNRVDRFEWNAMSETLSFDQNIVVLRCFQADVDQPLRGNHDGGVLRFGPGRGRDDAKLYVIVGDLGRRGATQNLPFGPFGPGMPDDQFGGPLPDDEHLSGVILRLDDDGSIPRDNPFFGIGHLLRRAGLEEVGENLQRIFAYGIRNSFGMAFEPRSGDLWTQENGDDSFSEINRVRPGFNGGWVQIMGPVSRLGQYKAIETGQVNPMYEGLQQIRWPPSRIADSPFIALLRLVRVPGSRYTDPELAWKFEVAPAGIEFLRGRGLGVHYEGDLFVGASRPIMLGGYLFRLPMHDNGRRFDFDDPRLADGVADNLEKHNVPGDPPPGLAESESLVFGRDFGVGTDIQTGPDGTLFVVSLSEGAVFEIARVADDRSRFDARLSGASEVPPRTTPASGDASFRLDRFGAELGYEVRVRDISNVIAAHIHLGPEGQNGPVVAFLFGPVPPGGGPFSGRLAAGEITAADLVGPMAGRPLGALLAEMRAGNTYVNVHTDDGNDPPNTGPGDFPGGEVRGQIR